MKITLLYLLVLLFIPAFIFSATWEQIECGGEFSVAIKSDGSLWAWGFNGNGQLGDGTLETSVKPVMINNDYNWKFVSPGSFHCLAIKSDGSLWAWGLNGNGQLGDGTNENHNSPVRIGTDYDWQIVSAGLINSYAIKNDGSLWAWGGNSTGQLGTDKITDSNIPVQVGTENNWKAVSAGGFFVIALKDDNTIWGWGNNQIGQTGIESNDEIIWEPTILNQDNDWSSISTGFEFAIALKSDGTLWGWGFNGNSQVGKPGQQIYSSPVKIKEDTDWSLIVCGSGYALAIKIDGTLWGWGFNANGQLGTSESAQIDTPKMISSDNEWLVIASAKGVPSGNMVFGSHTLALKKDKSVICGTGSNYVGQLGDGTLNNRPVFVCNTGDLTDVNYGSDLNFNIDIITNFQTNISNILINLDKMSNVQISLFDLLGNNIKTMDYPNLSEGSHSLFWDGMDNKNKFVPSGIYFCLINFIQGNIRFSEVRKLILLK